jgi:hypothetical protein
VTTLRDALADAIGKAEDGTLQAPTEQAIETSNELATEAPQEGSKAEGSRTRDERGRFAKVEQPAPQAQQPAAQTRKPPSSWKKDYWGHWEKLGTDPELSKLQEYIEQRESDYAKGVSTYKAQWDQAQPIYEAIQPFMPELQQHGIAPAQWIQNLGAAHRTLVLGSPEQKLQTFARLATEYGVPLQALQTGKYDPQFAHIANTVGALQRDWTAFQQQQFNAEQAKLQQEIDAFAATAPHFEEVRQTIAGLLRSGIASDLKTAYDKAIRLDESVWAKVQASQAGQAEKQRQAEIAKKKAAAVSPKSSSPTGAMAAGNTKKSLRDTLSEQFDEVAGGRF